MISFLGKGPHATTPNLGQGACQAFEDAWALADKLSAEQDVFKAVQLFVESRIKKTTYITMTLLKFAQVMNTSGFLKSVIMAFLRIKPEYFNTKQLDRIYSI